MNSENSLSSFPSLSREDEDLLERSVKKSKFGERDYHQILPDLVPKTPVVDMVMEEEGIPSKGEQGSTKKYACMPYKDSLAGFGGLTEKIPQSEAKEFTYPDSEDDEYSKEEDADHCPLICLTKEEKKI